MPTKDGGIVRILSFSPAFGLALLALAACTATEVETARPNILVIVADDLGYADLGSFGSDISTPNIDALAARGITFTQFHTASSCAPTRAMLLTGNNNHVAGVGQQGTSRDFAGLEGHLTERVAPLPRVLADAGYDTYTVGKWHLGVEPENGPQAVGFSRSFGVMDGAASHYSGVGFFEGGSAYRSDGVPFGWPDGAYSTELYTDRLIDFIDSEPADGRPFFAFAAYTSPHWPLQVPDEYMDLYSGRYDDGYDALRERRFESLKAAGIVPAEWTLPPRNDVITPWDELDAEQQRTESRKMELYAAMVDNLDDHVGRLIDHLKATGRYDNTLIVFMSDNGAAAEQFYEAGGYSEYLRANYDNSYENMGRPGSWVSYGPQWAEAGSAPFSRRKTYAREGGITAPMIISGPGVSREGVLDRSYVTVMDLAPTFIEMAEGAYPSDGSVRPMLGESITSLLKGSTDSVHSNDYVTTFLHGGRAYVRRGDWKLVTLEPPFTEEAFELFNLARDPGETTDLRDAEPELYAELMDVWRDQKSELGIVLLSEVPRR